MPATKHRRKKRLNQKQAAPAPTLPVVSNYNDTPVVKTRIKAGRLAVNHNEVVR
jgi:hypothetical protein